MKVTGAVGWALGAGSAGSLLGAWLIACGGPSFSAGPQDAGADGTLTESGSPDAAPPMLCTTPPCVLVSGLSSPVSVTLNSSTIFWANSGNPPGFTDGSLGRYDLTTGK